MGRSSRKNRYANDCIHNALPPAEAWKEPERWCQDESGRLKHIKTDDKIELPVDDRSFIVAEKAVHQVLDLFEEEYEWPVNDCCRNARVDNHHWYHPRLRYTSDPIAAEFRALAYNRALLPRQFHNVIHAVTAVPTIPSRTDMEKYSETHDRAIHFLKRLGSAASAVVELQERWRDYREQEEPCEVEYEMLRQQFELHFNRYGACLEHVHGMEMGYVTHLNERPARVARRLESVQRAIGACGVDYLAMFPRVA